MLFNTLHINTCRFKSNKNMTLFISLCMYILYQTLFIIFPRQKLENKNYNDTNTNVHVLESVTHDLQ